MRLYQLDHIIYYLEAGSSKVKEKNFIEVFLAILKTLLVLHDS